LRCHHRGVVLHLVPVAVAIVILTPSREQSSSVREQKFNHILSADDEQATKDCGGNYGSEWNAEEEDPSRRSPDHCDRQHGDTDSEGSRDQHQKTSNDLKGPSEISEPLTKAKACEETDPLRVGFKLAAAYVYEAEANDCPQKPTLHNVGTIMSGLKIGKS
jgi:hypothetical protein